MHFGQVLLPLQLLQIGDLPQLHCLACGLQKHLRLKKPLLLVA
jgi:hypothetical protein